MIGCHVCQMVVQSVGGGKATLGGPGKELSVTRLMVLPCSSHPWQPYSFIEAYHDTFPNSKSPYPNPIVSLYSLSIQFTRCPKAIGPPEPVLITCLGIFSIQRITSF